MREHQRRLGLRERKKARTRRAIQEHALRLFAERGYDATTVEQIAEAAEVSQSTFFRYFPTKEAVVLYDAYDRLVLELLAAQPPAMHPLAALRVAVREAFGRFSPEEEQAIQARVRLLGSHPALRARTLDGLLDAIERLAESIAARTGRAPGDTFVRALSGAFVGALIPAMFTWARSEADPGAQPVSIRPLAEHLDECLAYLEAGFPLGDDQPADHRPSAHHPSAHQPRDDQPGNDQTPAAT
ncbi:AcrR family transcriptional regulator [Thermocatellispora tengchongensis]|uniref:AcrR family transcriptional regulator n=1 Tax=Thermocatellispora tengchongensis TaxID=1073253 RepID=A0A840P4Y5_9ACTN|nr:TetR family transcriptional regulator [Thermocatellispora tengchongensis]MBB5134069.1 AcrR family transcriptional regulator [Thermocatellispora tengchongensis]